MKKIFLILIIPFVILLILFTPYYNFLKKTLKISPIKALFFKDSLKIYDNQVNIVLLGIAGGNHDGPNLSDSIMVVNYNMKNNQLTTIAIPRDIWSSTLKDKINSAYAYGEAKKIGGGSTLAKAELSSVVGFPIHYAVVIDFDEFKKLIDFLGGIDINVEKSFTDKEFPITGHENDLCNGDKEYRCRYKTISFEKGLQHMDGETTLDFIRSRNAEGDEGSDFARARRQQKMIEAIKNKLLKEIKFFDLKKIGETYSVIDKLIVRDITNQQTAILFRNIILKKNLRQKSVVLGEDSFVVPPYYEYEGMYVLIPASGNYDNLHQYISCQINNLPDCDSLIKKGEEKK